MTNPVININSINPGEYPAYIKDITLFNRGNTLVVETNFLLKQVLSSQGTQTAAADMRNRLLGKLAIFLVAITDRDLAQEVFQNRDKLKDFLPVPDTALAGRVKVRIYGIPTVAEKADIELAQMGALNGVDLPYSGGFLFDERNPDYLAVFAVPISKADASTPWQPDTTTIGLLASELVIKNGVLNTESTLFFKPGPRGNTSFDAGHRHPYEVSTSGNGTAEEVCLGGGVLLTGAAAETVLTDPVTAGPGIDISPGAPPVCHSHAITTGVVQPASNVPNGPDHSHNLVADPENGALWIGAVHKDSQGRWRTGAAAAPPGPLFVGDLLTSKTVHTSKIFDQRNLARIERLQVNFSTVKSLVGADVGGAFRKRLEVLNHLKGAKSTYISDVRYSKSTNNDLRLTFAFNYLDAIKRNAIYAPLYEQNSDLLATCTVKSFRVVRRRVKEANLYNKLTGGDTPQRIYDEEPLEIVGEPVRLGTLGLNAGVYQYMITDRTRVSNPAPAAAFAPPTGHRTVLHTGMDDITVGLYEYGIEVSIIDNTKSKLVDILRNETDGLDVLIPKIENFLTASLLKNNYNITTNRYTKGFLNTIQATYGSYLAPGAPWVAAAMKYISALQLLFGSQIGDIPTLRADLLVAVNPDGSGPTGMQFLLKILRDFASSLRTAIGEDHPRAPGAAQANATSAAGASSRLKTFKIQQFFLNPMNADDLLNYGLDYLSITPTPPASAPGQLRRFTAPQFNNLLDLQTQKYSQLPGTAVATQNPNVKFLTPNYLRMPDGTISNLFSAEEAEQDKASNNIYQLLRANMNRNSPLSFPSADPAPNNASSPTPAAQSARYLVQNQIMEMNSCGVSVFNQSIEDPIANIFCIPSVTTAGQDDYKHLADTNEYFSSTSKFSNPSPANIFLDFASGSTEHSLMLPGVGSDGANVEEAQQANSSVISEYLIQVDFFTEPGPNSPLPNLPPAGAYTVNNNTTLSAMQAAQHSTTVYMNSPQFAATHGAQGASSLMGPPPIGNVVVSEMDMAYVNTALAGEIKPENVALTAVKYGFVHVVEYLVGYKIANGESLLGEAVWAYLNDSIIQLVATGKTFLCRLKRHPSPMGTPRGLKIPTYDEYFILGSGNISSTVAPGTNPNVVPVGIPVDLLNNITEFSDSMEFASSYDSDIEYGSTPSSIFD